MPRPKPKLETPVRQLLVDLDGTLLGNRPLALGVDFLKRSFSELRPLGDLRKAAAALLEINREFGRPAHAGEPEFTNDKRVIAIFARRMGLTLDEGRRVLREGVLSIFPKLEPHFFPIEGAKEFLDWAKERYPLTLATNPVWPPEIVAMRVQWAGIDPSIFTDITHIRKMHACKPAREFYEEVLSQRGARAEDVLLIGDNLKMDLPATKVGIRVFIIDKKRDKKRGDKRAAPKKSKTPEPLRHEGARAPAWRGTYPALRAMLEEAPS
jgi:FMN phosphatase YigB (HAD superfamily)